MQRSWGVRPDSVGCSQQFNGRDLATLPSTVKHRLCACFGCRRLCAACFFQPTVILGIRSRPSTNLQQYWPYGLPLMSTSPVGYPLKCRGHPPGQSLGGNFKSPDRSGHQPFLLHPELPPSLFSSVAEYSRMVITRHLEVRSYIVSFCNLIEVLFVS